MHTSIRFSRFVTTSVVGASLLAGCAGAPGPSPAPSPSGTSTSGAPMMNTTWPVMTREHVDLWLHTYAMLAPDTMPLPYFSRGYRERIGAVRRQRGVTSLLDQTRDKLVARLAVNTSLGTNGQFVPLYFPSWETMRQAIDVFVRGNAQPSNATEQMYLAVLGGAFPTVADREWLRQFADAADDESRRFYHDYWTTENRARAGVVSRVDSLWQRQWRPSLQRFLNNTQQQNGELYLSMPIGGEGRTIHFGKGENAIAVPMPGSAADLESVLYVMVHEIAGNAASSAIADNTTPAEQRAGTTSRYEQAAAVRAGAMLLERTIPSAVAGYMRYYLQQAGRSAPNDPRAAFTASYAIPDAVRDAITRQLDVILGGI